MNVSTKILLGMAAVGIQAGLALAADAPANPPALVIPAPSAISQEGCPTPGCLDCGPQECCHGGLIGGAGLYVVQPYCENNLAFALISQVQPDNSPASVQRVDVKYHMEAAPLIWLGYLTDDGIGARARYWYFREGTSQGIRLAPFVEGEGAILQTATSATPLGLEAFGDTLSDQHGPEGTEFVVTTKFEMQVLDLEGLLDYRLGDWSFLLCGGVRLAHIDETYNAYDAQSTSAAELRTLLSHWRFNGVGPVVAVEARDALGSSGLSFYTSGRAAVLFGPAQQDATFGGQELRNEDANPQIATLHRNQGIPVGELEVGLEYGRNLGGARLSGQIALVAQDWIGVGNASHSTPTTPPNAPPATGGATVDTDMALFGLVFRIGLDY